MVSAFEQGVAAARIRNIPVAEACFRRALAENPADALARAWLGQAQCAKGEVRDGAGNLLTAGRAMIAAPPQPRTAAALQQIIGQLQQWGALAEAVALLDALVARNPNDAGARSARATTYAMLNQPAEALADARHARSLIQPTAASEVFLASLEADAGLSAEAEARLRAVLAADPAPRETYRALKELARLLDRRGAAADAFDCLEQAARIWPEVPEYAALDRALLPRRITENQAQFTPELISRWAGHDFGDRAAPTFVFGFFRSGTTLTQEVLASHKSLFVSDEVGLISAMGANLARMAPGHPTAATRLASLGGDGIASLRESYWRMAQGRHGEAALAGRFVDKFTMNVIDAGLIATVFPDARFVFMVRDPRDVCLSAFQQLMVPTAATAHLLDWESTARFYAQVTEWWRHLRPMLRLPVIELRYEDAVADFTGTYTRLLDFIGVGWDDAVSRFHERAAGKFISTPSRGQVARPLYASSVGRWRRHPAPFARIAAYLAPSISAYGYPE